MKLYIGDNIQTVFNSEGTVLSSVECAKGSTNCIKYYCRESAEIMAVDASMINFVGSPASALLELASKESINLEWMDKTVIPAGEFKVCFEYAWTPDEMADVVMSLCGSDDDVKASLKECPEDRLIEYHQTLGRFIRNHFLLWQNSVLQYPKGLERHPDSFSMEVIRLFREKLRS